MNDEEAYCAILTDAREYLSDESHWLRDGRYMSTADNADLATADFAYHPELFEGEIKCCAIGAMYRAASLNESIEKWRVHNLVRACGKLLSRWIPEEDADNADLPQNVPVWNDHGATHESLLATFDKAKEGVCGADT